MQCGLVRMLVRLRAAVRQLCMRCGRGCPPPQSPEQVARHGGFARPCCRPRPGLSKNVTTPGARPKHTQACFHLRHLPLHPSHVRKAKRGTTPVPPCTCAIHSAEQGWFRSPVPVPPEGAASPPFSRARLFPARRHQGNASCKEGDAVSPVLPLPPTPLARAQTRVLAQGLPLQPVAPPPGVRAGAHG